MHFFSRSKKCIGIELILVKVHYCSDWKYFQISMKRFFSTSHIDFMIIYVVYTIIRFHNSLNKSKTEIKYKCIHYAFALSLVIILRFFKVYLICVKYFVKAVALNLYAYMYTNSSSPNTISNVTMGLVSLYRYKHSNKTIKLNAVGIKVKIVSWIQIYVQIFTLKYLKSNTRKRSLYHINLGSLFWYQC